MHVATLLKETPSFSNPLLKILRFWNYYRPPLHIDSNPSHLIFSDTLWAIRLGQRELRREAGKIIFLNNVDEAMENQWSGSSGMRC